MRGQHRAQMCPKMKWPAKPNWLRSERRRGRVGPSGDVSTKKDLSQNNSVVMSLIMRGKNECNPSSLSEGA